MNISRSALACIAFATLLMSGCYTVHTTPLDPPINRELRPPDSFTVLPGGVQDKSIGDVLFECRRYKEGAFERVGVPFRPGQAPFPDSPGWAGTHQYTASDGSKFTVYTHPAFYKGTIGVILNNQDYLATPTPLVRVAGFKAGREWKLKSDRKFFYVPTELIESWGLRYGGHRGPDFIFEIIDRPNPTVVQVVQSLQIGESEFLKGFVVKGVLVRGIGDDGNGIIRYTLTDVRDAKPEVEPSVKL